MDLSKSPLLCVSLSITEKVFSVALIHNFSFYIEVIVMDTFTFKGNGILVFFLNVISSA